MASLALILVLLLAGGDLDAARKALAANQPRKALELLGDLGEGDDVPVDVYVVQGRAHLRLREYAAAVEPLLRASDARPDDKVLARDGAIACWGSASGAYAAAYLADARRLAERAGDARLLADLYHAGGDFEQALAAYRALKPTAKERLGVLDRIADCLRRLDRQDEAKAAYAAALEEALRVRDLRVAFRVAFAADQGGRYLAWLDAEIAKTPGDIDLRLQRGYARANGRMYPEAAEDLRVVLAKHPEFVEAKARLCAVLLAEGTRAQRDDLVREGEALGRAILEKNPRHQRTWQQMGWLTGIYWADRRIERYYGLLKFLNRLDPKDIVTALNFGGAARRLGDYAGAERAFRALLEVSPDDPDVLNDLAILHDARGEREKAIALWERALAEESDNINALENLHTDAWERGDTERALELIERGLRAAEDRDDPALKARWEWFLDRRRWAPAGFGRSR